MLATNPHMLDLDTEQWRNLQTLLTVRSAGQRRIVVIHDHGVVQKLAHSDDLTVQGGESRIDDAAATARRLYEANQAEVDFVLVLERSAVDDYYGRVQDTWDPDEDFDVYVHRGLALLDDVPDGIAVHPGPASERLGLQFRLGGTYEQVTRAAVRLIGANGLFVLGVLDGDRLWASLILHLDDDAKVDRIATGVPWRFGDGSAQEELLAQVRADYGEPVLGVFGSRDAVRRLAHEGAAEPLLRELIAAGDLVFDPTPDGLKETVH